MNLMVTRCPPTVLHQLLITGPHTEIVSDGLAIPKMKIDQFVFIQLCNLCNILR